MPCFENNAETGGNGAINQNTISCSGVTSTVAGSVQSVQVGFYEDMSAVSAIVGIYTDNEDTNPNTGTLLAKTAAGTIFDSTTGVLQTIPLVTPFTVSIGQKLNIGISSSSDCKVLNSTSTTDQQREMNHTYDGTLPTNFSTNNEYNNQSRYGACTETVDTTPLLFPPPVAFI